MSLRLSLQMHPRLALIQICRVCRVPYDGEEIAKEQIEQVLFGLKEAYNRCSSCGRTCTNTSDPNYRRRWMTAARRKGLIPPKKMAHPKP